MGLCYSSQKESGVGTAGLEHSIYCFSTTHFLCWWRKKSKSNSLTHNKKKKKRKRRRGSKHQNNFGGSGSGSIADELHRIPGRSFVNGATDSGCLYTQQGRKGSNQDAMLLWENFSSKEDTTFCGVFDGHGPYGHVVSKRVRDSLPLKLSAMITVNSVSDQNSSTSMDFDETASISMDDEWCHSDSDNRKIPEMFQPLKDSFLKAFKLMDKELKMHPTIDCFCSGTTAVALVKQGQDLVIANVGDSRAVLGTRDNDNCLVALQLTVDLKPNLPREAERIHKFKGRVFALQDEPEVARVWLPNSDSPGLAMARAFGDFCLKDFGLIAVPDISYHHLTERDEFIILASDGVWDVLSNEEVVDIVASAPSRTTAARALVDTAVRAWKLKFPTSKSDDCAVVCLFVDHPTLTNQVQEFTFEERHDNADTNCTTDYGAEDVHVQGSDMGGCSADGPPPHHSSPLGSSDEIVPVYDLMEEKLPERCQSTRSLAECISTAEDEEWSALEGVTRVNSLLNLPRFLSGEKSPASWMKWF